MGHVPAVGVGQRAERVEQAARGVLALGDAQLAARRRRRPRIAFGAEDATRTAHGI